MGNRLEYKKLYGSESFGQHGAYGIEIFVASSELLDFDSEKINEAIYKAAGIISAEVQAAAIAENTEVQEKAKKERDQLIGIFNDRVFVEEIPNGYCSDWCCRHLPWFVVTTEVGRFKIGWRKRVINIDWSETVGTKNAKELFSDEDVTKGERYIHAWSIDDARRYIDKIIAYSDKKFLTHKGAITAKNTQAIP